MGAWLGGIGRRDDLVRTLLAVAVVAALGLGGAALGTGSVIGQQGSGSGSSSSGEGSASGSSSSAGSESGGTSSSGSQGGDGTSSSNGASTGSSGAGDDDVGGDGVPDDGVPDDGTPDDGSPDTTTPSAPTTTIASSASTIPSDLPADVPPTAEVGCPDDVASSAAGGRVRCFTVDPDDLDAGDEVREVGIPGIPVPVPLPTGIVVPVVGDTGDSGSTHNDNRVTVVYDIDNRVAVDGFADDTGRAGQRILATLALLLLLPVWVVLLVALRRLLLRPAAAAPPVPPPPAGRWVWEPGDPDAANDGDEP